LARRWGHWRVCEQASQKKKEKKKESISIHPETSRPLYD
jgi:hypothetical protein